MNPRIMEQFISRVLRLGVLTSGGFMVLGLALLWWSGDASCPNGVLTLNWMLWGAPFLEPSHILFMGLFLLVATPLARVATSIVAYIYERDLAYTVITGIVFLVLMVGILLGFG